MNKKRIHHSKFMSLVLRHQPHPYGLTLDAHGWAQIDDLVAAAQRAGVPLTREEIEEVVAQNDKQRFAISDNGTAIRARQGHSVAVDLELALLEPPAQLFHGTAERFVASIRQQGLIRGSRQYVHLSADPQTAIKVGQRHGRPVILTVTSALMHRESHCFYLSENGVWLVDAVPAHYITFPE